MPSFDPIASVETDATSAAADSPPTVARRTLGWATLLGQRLPLERPSRRLFLIVLAGTTALGSARLLGWPAGRVFAFGPAAAGPDVAHLCLEIVTGLLFLLSGAYVLSWSRVSSEATPIGLGVLLATTGAIGILHGATAWRGESTIEPVGAVWSWTIARTWFCAGLFLVLWLGRHRGSGSRRLLAVGTLAGGTTAALLATLGESAPDLLQPTAVVVRPWDLACFFLLIGSASFFLGPFHRRLPSPLTHALIVAMIPATIGQLFAGLGWLRPWDADSGLAHLMVLLSALTLAAGVVIDGGIAHRRRLAALQRVATTETRLSLSTSALEKVDRDLVREAAQRRRAEQSLKLVQKAVSTMSLGATITDPEGRIVYVNEAEASMHGWEVDDLLGRPAAILAPEGPDRPTPSETLEGWAAWTRETVNVTREGRRFPVRLVSDAVIDEDGTVLGQVTICEDITERERLRRMRTEFVTVVSHELRTPLTSLLASLSILRQGLSPRERDEMLDICDRNGQRLRHLIDDLLDLQKLSAGRLSLRPENVLLAPIVAEAAARISTLAAEKDIAVDVDVSDRIEVHADRRRLAQILDNLLSNAIKFSPSETRIRVSGSTDAQTIGISVTDEGPGIPDSYLDEIFEPFSQEDGSSTRRAGGTGLGLHIVRALAEAMGGRVDVETETDPARSGTTFRVFLPSSSADERTPEAADGPNPS